MSALRLDGRRCHRSLWKSMPQLRIQWRSSDSCTEYRRRRIAVNAEAGSPEARRRELEERVRRLALDEDNLDDEELVQLWEELQGCTMDAASIDPEEKEEAKENMQSFLETLFYQLSLNRNEAILSKEKVKRIFSGLPKGLAKKFEDVGIWDRLPTAGFTTETIDQLELWTQEEYEVFSDDPHRPPPVDEEEEVRRELTLVRAVRKLEQFLSTYPDDPAEVLNMMVAAKMAYEANRDPFNPADFILDDVDEEEFGDDVDYLVDIDGIEACLAALERGEDAPAPDPSINKVIAADTPEAFKERLQLMKDFYTDPLKKREDRSLSKQEYKEIKRRWDAFMPDEEPLVFKDIDHIRSLTGSERQALVFRLAPALPDWMEKHFRSLQHITYILRAAHINAKITEPGKRLKKYDRIADVTYSDPAVEIQGHSETDKISKRLLSGYAAFMEQMERLERAGVTTEPFCLFGEVDPPKEKFDDPEIENPWNYTIVVDEHLNIPIPDWYHSVLDAYEAKMDKEDFVADDSEIWDSKRYDIIEDMDKILKKKTPKKKREGTSKKPSKMKDPHPSEVASDDLKRRFDDLGVGIKDGDPKLYQPVYADTKGGSKKSKSGYIVSNFHRIFDAHQVHKRVYMKK